MSQQERHDLHDTQNNFAKSKSQKKSCFWRIAKYHSLTS